MISKVVYPLVLSTCLLFTWDASSISIEDMQTDTGYTNIFISSDSIWNSVREDLALDLKTDQPEVKRAIKSLLQNKKKLIKILTRSAPYIYYIHTETQKRGLPGELSLIPVVESEFSPNDFSTAGATGLWQLMPGTARELGVKVRPGYDGRKNIKASTQAALSYFKDLGANFAGNWYLAIAAYNAGQGKISSAVRRAKTKNFFQLKRLPRETRFYVPKLLAVAEIVKHPSKYGIELPHISNKPYFKEVSVTKPTSLSHYAKKSGISLATLKTLNPDYKYSIVKRKSGYTVLIPIDDQPAVSQMT